MHSRIQKPDRILDHALERTTQDRQGRLRLKMIWELECFLTLHLAHSASNMMRAVCNDTRKAWERAETDSGGDRCPEANRN